MTRKNVEVPKVIVDNSITKAFWRCLPHILPISTTILVLFINTKGIFIGSDFIGPIKSETINIMLLQIAAKAHELLIVTSLGLIVVQMVRHELLFGDGLPLGLIGSGISFSDVGFFFRKEFYGALRYVAQGSIPRKALFLTVLLLAGLTAALAGPASAVLLVPKSQTWPTGGSQFYLNGSSEQLWPEDLSGDLSELSRYCGTSNSTRISICPGAGYSSLWQHFGRVNYTNFFQQDVRTYAKNLSGSHFYWPVHSADSLIPPLYALGDFRQNNESTASTFLVQPHAGVATMLQRVADDWWEALVTEQKTDPRIIDDRQVSALLVRNAFASVRCSEPQNLSLADTNARLPTVRGRFDYATESDFDISMFSNRTSGHMRFNWIHLPATFGAASIGAIFESTWTSNNQSRIVVGCTSQLGWIPATLFTDQYTFWTGWYPWDLKFGQRTPSFMGDYAGMPLSSTDGRIALGDQWLNLLTPIAPVAGQEDQAWQPTTIESIIANAGLDEMPGMLSDTEATTNWLNTDAQVSGSRVALLEAIIANVLVDGLSRTVSYRVFDTSGSPSQWSLSPYNPRTDFSKALLSNRTAFIAPDSIPSSNLTTLRVDMLISGFAFRNSLAGFLSMAVLLTHFVMAMVHTIWILSNRHSSWSWSGVAELIALAQNSTPTASALKNTGAGIEKAATFASIAKIRVKPDLTGSSPDRVELVFENEQEEPTTTMMTTITTKKDARVAIEMQKPQHTGGFAVQSADEFCVVDARKAPSRGPRHAETWPGHNNVNLWEEPDTSLASASMEVQGGRWSSEERLLPPIRALLAGERQAASDVVQVNCAYG